MDEISLSVEPTVFQGKDGEPGITFTPSIDADGNLSWSNDGGKQNPPTMNIKGAEPLYLSFNSMTFKGSMVANDADKAIMEKVLADTNTPYILKDSAGNTCIKVSFIDVNKGMLAFNYINGGDQTGYTIIRYNKGTFSLAQSYGVAQKPADGGQILTSNNYTGYITIPSNDWIHGDGDSDSNYYNAKELLVVDNTNDGFKMTYLYFYGDILGNYTNKDFITYEKENAYIYYDGSTINRAVWFPNGTEFYYRL